MKKLRILGLLLLPLLLLASTAWAAPKGAVVAGGGVTTFKAELSGDEETPPVDTKAHGSVIYILNADGTEMTYHLVAANIEHVIAGHIHVGAFGVAGPVVVPLVTPTACTTLNRAVMCEGTITASNLVGPLAGHPLSDLIAAMEAGNTYTNVHTTAHPAGEIRGQNR